MYYRVQQWLLTLGFRLQSPGCLLLTQWVPLQVRDSDHDDRQQDGGEHCGCDDRVYHCCFLVVVSYTPIIYILSAKVKAALHTF